MEELTKWDERYLALAKEISKWSKDPSTQVGALTVGSKGQLLSQGYNGFPRGIEDSFNRYKNKKLKYDLTAHAEANTIYNASHSGICLNNATMYIYGLPPCPECTKGIIQVGIKKVVIEKSKKSEWDEKFEISKVMFQEAKIEVIVKKT